MLFKSVDGGIKDIDQSKGIVKFAFANFGTVDSDGDVIQKGAYNKTISESGPKGSDRIYHYKNHNNNVVVGKPIEIYEDGEFAIMVSKMSQNTAGRDALIEYQEGIIKEHSQGFYTEKQSQKDNYNLITEVRLVEASTLTKAAANPNTPTIDVKNNELEYLIKELSKRFKIGNFSDEYYISIEKQIESLTKQFHSVKPSTLTFTEPINDVYDSTINLFKNINI